MKLSSEIEKEESLDIEKLRSSPSKMDLISQLPDCILIYIMTFISTQVVVQTSVLSKRWKNLWKFVPALIANNTQFPKTINFWIFLNSFLLYRDGYSPLNNIVLDYNGLVSIQTLTKLFTYGVSHKAERIVINSIGEGYHHLKNVEISQFMVSCSSIKYLKLLLGGSRGKVIVSHALDLPELTYCHFKEVGFLSNSSNGNVDPFSSCKKLTTLIIESCNVMEGTKLFVSNDTLSRLVIHLGACFVPQLIVQMNTPNLKSFTIAGCFNSVNHTCPLFVHDLKFLEQVSLELWFPRISEEIANTFMSWLKMFTNVSSMTLASPTLLVFKSMPNFPNIEDVCFENMESVLVKIDSFASLFPMEVFEYLVKNSRCNEITTTFAGNT
ncbi:putative F-box/LRR-repeat protein At4g15060 [Vicia villosa]|uniref:putative F-box/LRR-repeat protein At4g15060 n=1 Tax=Vicia villosa TaxID=3911 RepID=UPI00273B0B8F|nr:putative F-box/LRR-repeat protein At4g15060 [Vicia villosa]